MKKYFLCFAGFFIASFMFAENGKLSANDLLLNPLNVEKFSEAGDGLRNSMNDLVQQANNLGNGNGFVGATFDPAGFGNIMALVNIRFCKIWGIEVGGGWSKKNDILAVEVVDPLNFQWILPFLNSGFFSMTAGVGCPLIFIPNKGDSSEVFGVKPSAIIGFHLWADKEYGASFFIEPGYIVDFKHSENRKFSIPMGIMFKMPSSIIAGVFSAMASGM
ncbi:hypothetical protein [uncultured Treponema sp.]|uniref:hypothetical protein n=1 Tax=uncultured Treponema sp. TaxID=162155 RepID=UPI00258A9A2A|nr:hypothetical protein [uncultured Treponema sp.]